MLGVGESGARLVLRAYSFEGDNRDFAHAGWQDFAVQGLCNSGYYDLQSQPEAAAGVLGLVNDHGHFRPLVRGESVALPQHATPAQPAPPPPAVNGSKLDESAVIARLPKLTDLPEELLKAPDELAFFERDSASTVIEAAAVELRPTMALDESAIHEAILSGNCKILPANEAAQAASEPASPKRAGASEQLASMWSDSWDEHASLHLRAEISIEGRLGPGLKLALGNQVIRPLPDGHFKIVRQLTKFTEVWPLFSMLSLLEKASGALELAKGEDGESLLDLHASIHIEGRINDEDYSKFLPPDVTPDSDGRFTLHRALPNGAVLLPGLSLLAEG